MRLFATASLLLLLRSSHFSVDIAVDAADVQTPMSPPFRRQE
jgi:hypothetical protein